MNKLFALLFACGLAFFATGCFDKVDEEGRKNISGTVTLDDVSIERGNIQFSPKETQAPAGAGIVGGSTEIINGKYELKKDLGLFVGTYTVRITSMKVTDPKTGEAPDPAKYNASPESFKHEQLIPEQYNSKTTLELIVGDEKNQTHDFTLKSK